MIMIGTTEIEVVKGDIAEQQVDVIVNAANSELMGGGGVDGAIHRAGGPQILEACRQIRETEGRCEPGRAVITTAGALPARWVIHTVGPIWSGGDCGEADLLASAYQSSLKLADEVKAVSIAFPSISTGTCGYPVDQAAVIAVSALAIHATTDTTLRFIKIVTFSEEDQKVYDETLNKLRRENT